MTHPRRTIIIGDVHGMHLELRDLIFKVGVSTADRVVFCGDLLDKGPNSCSVVTFARSLREQGVEIILVQGNHEEKHARFRLAFEKAGEKGVKSFSGLDELRAITEGLSSQDIAFLDSAVPFFEMPEFNAVVVHGGITADMEVLDASDKGLVSRLLRTRHVRGKTERKITIEFTVEGDGTFNITELVRLATQAVPVREQRKAAGSFLSLGTETDDDPFWADVYDGRFGHVFFGHSPFISETGEPKRFPHATGLDTGAVFGGHLTAAVLEEGQEVRFVSVKASNKFATGLWDE